MRSSWLLFILLIGGGCAHSAPQAVDRVCLNISYELTQAAPPPKLSSTQKLPLYLELLPTSHPLAMPDLKLHRLYGQSQNGAPAWLLERASWSSSSTGLEIDWGTGLSGHRIHLTGTKDGSYRGTVDLYNDVPVAGANISGLYTATATRVRCY